MSRAVGIDLGTTNSVVGTIVRGRPQVIPSPTTDEDWTPSLVAREGGDFVVGRDVEAIVQTKASAAAHSVKRLIGRRFEDDEVQRMITETRFAFPIIEHPLHPGEIGIELDDLIMTPAEVSAQVLRTLRADVERQIGESVGHAVITVPAYFRDPSIYATREAGRLAGLRVHHVMPEPTAAALAYALGEEASGAGARHVLVYDFGGGTFDVSILLVAPGAALQVLAVDGNNFLGGDDIDLDIARRWNDEMRAEHHVSVFDGTGMSENGPYPVKAVEWTLKLAARETKERLAGSAPARKVTKPGLILRDDGTTISPTWTLSRDELAAIANPRVNQTFEVVERALHAAHLTPGDINDVVVVGGSTKLAGVLDQLRLMFAHADIRNSINPMLVVGIGAAQQTRMALPWNCTECGRTNEATADRCIGCGTDADQPEHDCETCGAIFAATDEVCPNAACATRIVRPDAPVEALSHAYRVRLVGGSWETLADRGTPVFTARRDAAPPSAWVELAAARSGQQIELPIGQDHDDRGQEPNVIAHFKVVDAPADIVAGQKVAVRLRLDGDRVSSLEAEIRGRIYETARVEFAAASASTVVGEDGIAEAEPETKQANWYRFLSTSSRMLPVSARNPAAAAFLDELRTASDQLQSIADRVEAAELAGNEAEVATLTAEADGHISENLPLVPALSLAMLMTQVTEDLDARRDLQAGIEDVLQALAVGNADDVKLAFASLDGVMSNVQMPSGDVAGVDANLLTHMRQ